MPEIFNSHIKPTVSLDKKSGVKSEVSQNQPGIIEKFEKDKHFHNPLSAFSVQPNGVKFTIKDPDEKIIVLLRKHPITNLPWVMVALFAVILPPFFQFLDIYTFLPVDYRFVINLSWYLFVTAYVLEKFLQWFFNVNVITDERIIDVDFHNLIYREISDANIDQVQDVSSSIGGGIRTFLNYGNVTVQTAAELLKIEMIDIPRPDDVAKILRELRVQEEKEKLEGRVR